MKQKKCFFNSGSYQGFTLIEVLVSFAVGMMFLAVFTQAHQVFIQNIKKTQKKILKLYRFQNNCVSQQNVLFFKHKGESFQKKVLLKNKEGLFIKIVFQKKDKNSPSILVFQPF